MRCDMRRNFAQVLKAGKIDIKNEYTKLYTLFYCKSNREKHSLADLISRNFGCFYFRRTCLNLEEFDKVNEFNFEENPQNFNVDYLVSFSEYIFNFIIHFDYLLFPDSIDKDFFVQHILKVIDAIGYMQASEDGFIIFVPKDNIAMSVSESELVPEKISYKIISYNHHSTKGDLEAKKQTLIILADLLEPKRKELETLDRQFASDLFYAFNNFNIRHNNIDETGKYYKQTVADLSIDELENWYDNTYQMCLLAFMKLEHIERKSKFDVLKNKIETKK